MIRPAPGAALHARSRAVASGALAFRSVPRPKSLRSQLYRAARDLGNAQAASRGPGALGKRYVRRAVYRKTNRGVWGVLRALGLGGGRRR